MELSQDISLKTKQILSQAQIQSLEILAMDAIELEEFLQNEYLDNPLLEQKTDSDASGDENSGMSSAIDENVSWFDGEDRPSVRQRGEDADWNALQNLSAPEENYLQNFFLSQLDYHMFSAEEWMAALYMIDCLEDNGFYTMSVEETARATHLSPKQIDRILEQLKTLEPCGVFSADLCECLLRQLEAAGEKNAVLEQMIRDYLPVIAEGRFGVLSETLHLSPAQVRDYVSVIAGLNPRPLSGISRGEVTYIVPDIIYTYENGTWKIAVNEGNADRYYLNDYYVNMMKGSKDAELHAYFKQKLERARFVLNSVEQRKHTMHSIAKAILQRQEPYFLGKGELSPMTMSSVAEELDIHPSTVSRAVKGKYVKSPVGTVQIKNLFLTGVSAGDSGKVSARHIKGRIRAIIDGEDKRKPYSDAKLVDLLASEGIAISRRAVQKYRDEMWIKNSFERKDYPLV